MQTIFFFFNNVLISETTFSFYPNVPVQWLDDIIDSVLDLFISQLILHSLTIRTDMVGSITSIGMPYSK